MLQVAHRLFEECGCFHEKVLKEKTKKRSRKTRTCGFGRTNKYSKTQFPEFPLSHGEKKIVQLLRSQLLQ